MSRYSWQDTWEDYYKILGIDRQADADEIKQAWRGFAIAHHPDPLKSEAAKKRAEARFKRGNRAYDVLSNPTEKYDYDQEYDKRVRATKSSTGTYAKASGTPSSRSSGSAGFSSRSTGYSESTSEKREERKSAPPLFKLTVVNGSGSGSYPAGNAVTITANSPAAGKTFSFWTGAKFANERKSTTTFFMPAADTMVTAVYKDVPPPKVYNPVIRSSAYDIVLEATQGDIATITFQVFHEGGELPPRWKLNIRMDGILLQDADVSYYPTNSLPTAVSARIHVPEYTGEFTGEISIILVEVN